MPRLLGKVFPHGPGKKYCGLSLPVSLCREIGINPGSHVYLEQRDNNSLVVGVFRRV